MRSIEKFFIWEIVISNSLYYIYIKMIVFFKCYFIVHYCIFLLICIMLMFQAYGFFDRSLGDFAMLKSVFTNCYELVAKIVC